MTLRDDGTTDCELCNMPMFPIGSADDDVTLECANRHRVTVDLPRDAKLRRFVHNWVARRGAQLDEQHRRWESDDDVE